MRQSNLVTEKSFHDHYFNPVTRKRIFCSAEKLSRICWRNENCSSLKMVWIGRNFSRKGSRNSGSYSFGIYSSFVSLPSFLYAIHKQWVSRGIVRVLINRAIINASPLIVLLKSQQIELLPQLIVNKTTHYSLLTTPYCPLPLFNHSREKKEFRKLIIF